MTGKENELQNDDPPGDGGHCMTLRGLQARSDARPRLWPTLKEDLKRYIDRTEFNIFDVAKAVYHNECAVFLISYRVTQSIRRIRNPLLRLSTKLFLTTVFHRFLSILLGIRIHPTASIGRGFYIGHPGAIFINSTEIGEYCNISQEVTIGLGKVDEQRGVPKIGNHVYIGPGAKLFGGISIGNNVSIGANAVVSKTIPDNAVVVGNPGRIVGYQDRNTQIHNTESKTYQGVGYLLRDLIRRKRPPRCP